MQRKLWNNFKEGYSYQKKSFNVPLYKTQYQAINGVLELENEATKPTDILEDKRDVQAL